MAEPVRYKVICPKCNYGFDVARSIFMDMGINMGSCHCPKCDLFLHLECDEDTKTMKSEEYEIFANREMEKQQYEAKVLGEFDEDSK